MEIDHDNSSEALKKNTETKRRRKKKKDVTPSLKEQEGKARNAMEEDNHVTCRDLEGIASKQKCGGQKKIKKRKVMLQKTRADEALDPKTGKKDSKEVKVCPAEKIYAFDHFLSISEGQKKQVKCTPVRDS